ncbi:MAG: hypothetical protein Phyf2KO_18260 [Phycisphaerales bacterium]
MPASIRRNYRKELPGTAFFSIARAAFDGAVLGIIVKIAFDGVVTDSFLNTCVAVLSSAPALANIVNFIWARASHGKNKIKFIAGVQIALLLQVLLIALVPKSPAGLVLLCAIIIGVWTCWSGYIAIRSTIWRNNYPRSLRARVAGKFSTIQTLTLSTLGLALAILMGDKLSLVDPRFSLEALGLDPIQVFRVYIIVCVLFGAVGIGILSSIRVRKHKQMLRDERESISERSGPTINPAGVIKLLLEDKRFGVYQVNQFLMGMGNLMIMPLIPILFRDRFGIEYFEGILLASVIPMAVVPMMIPVWARLLDRVHVVMFRAYHCWVFILIIVLLLLATVLQAKWLLYVTVTLKGTALAGGMLAWQLGHHDFAPKERAGEYMGVHVTLTGVRGLIGPIVSVLLYNWLAKHDPELAPWVLLVCLALVVTGAIGFVMMARRLDLTPCNDEGPATSKTKGPAPVSRAEV